MTSDSYLIGPSVEHLSAFKEPFVREKSPSFLPARVRQTYWKSFHWRAAIKEKISQAIPHRIETSPFLSCFLFISPPVYTQSLKSYWVMLVDFRVWIFSWISALGVFTVLTAISIHLVEANNISPFSRQENQGTENLEMQLRMQEWTFNVFNIFYSSPNFKILNITKNLYINYCKANCYSFEDTSFE